MAEDRHIPCLRPYTELLNKHEGQTAFVVGAGPSLNDWVNHPQNRQIHDHVVVAVNSSFITMPWGTGDNASRYWISNDALCRWWSYWEPLKRSHCTGIVRDSWKEYFDEIPDFYQFSPRPTAEGVIHPEDTGLAYCSSVPSGIDLCLQMGIKRIFLLGVDHYLKKGKSHFWQSWPSHAQPRRKDGGIAPVTQQERTFAINAKAFAALKAFADFKGATIYNVSPQSNVEAFEKINLEQMFDIV